MNLIQLISLLLTPQTNCTPSSSLLAIVAIASACYWHVRIGIIHHAESSSAWWEVGQGSRALHSTEEACHHRRRPTSHGGGGSVTESCIGQDANIAFPSREMGTVV